ncbi:hypothetical protein WJX72_000047 [[Myrmecia] bisecta]|uniref:Bacteriophage/plasmid primase P4 C-terminal domain-containing protein n=1 Tax=[Myrmecia] bisecta TaxID=41462 RepID=A0AAW1PE55_9CHLO
MVYILHERNTFVYDAEAPDASFAVYDGTRYLRGKRSKSAESHAESLVARSTAIKEAFQKVEADMRAKLEQGDLHKDTRKGYEKRKTTALRIRTQKLEDVKFRRGVVTQLCGLEQVKQPGFMSRLNGEESVYLQAFTNGVIDLRVTPRQLRPGRPSDMVTERAAYAYGPRVEAKVNRVAQLWAQWLVNKDGTPNPEFVKYVSQLIASALDGVVRLSKQAILALIGWFGGEGKTLFITWLEGTIGGAATTFSTSIFSQKWHPNKPNDDLANAVAGRLAFGGELPADPLIAHQLKLVCAGENMGIKRSYESSTPVTVRCFAVCTTNADPVFTTGKGKEGLGADSAVGRRLVVVDFNSSFRHQPKADQKKAIDDLTAELFQDDMRLANMHFLLDAYQQAAECGFQMQQPDIVQEATQRVLNPLKPMLGNVFEITPGENKTASRIEAARMKALVEEQYPGKQALPRGPARPTAAALKTWSAATKMWLAPAPSGFALALSDKMVQ